MNRRAIKTVPAGLAIALMALAVCAQTVGPPGGRPLYFEANRGQADRSAQFLARGRDSQFLISPAEAQIGLRKAAAAPVTVRMQFLGANPQAQIRGDAGLSGKINYLTGNNPALWHTSVPTFAKVRVEEIYPGIGLVYYGNQQKLEYDFNLQPGANPGAIQIHFDGAGKIAVNAQGELVLTLSGGEIRQARPVIYQLANGIRREISGGYRLMDAHTVAFAVGAYDHRLPLVIDPVLSYSTYFGGNAGEAALSVKVDASGSVYVTGQTFSPRFAATNTPGAYQTNSGGSLSGDAFVAKFDNSGTNLIYFTYLGGSADDYAVDLAVDDAGRAYITGYTDSTNFPTRNALYPKIGGTNIVSHGQSFGYNPDAFVTELETNGAALVYSTYLGGNSLDAGVGIAVDSAHNAYITGRTCSTNFPTTNAFQLHLQCTNSVFFGNAFVTEISAGGSNLIYSSYFGGNNYDSGGGIAVDPAGYVYVAGATASTNFPTTNSLSSLLNGSTNQTSTFDAFVAKFMPSCTGLVYSTYLGSSNYDVASRITCDAAGDAYVVGATASPFFTNTTGANIIANYLTNNLNLFFPITTNGFLTEINPNGAAILNSAVFGGDAMDLGYGLALDPAGNIFVVGTTISTNFPASTNNLFGFLRATNSGGSDVFVLAFTNNFSRVIYSACLGGNNNDFGYGIAVDAIGDAYVVGQTLSTNFPTLSARQTTLNGTNDAFLAKITSMVPRPAVTVSPTNQTLGVNSTATFSATATGTPPFFYQWQAGGTNLTDGTNAGGSTISGSTNATLNIFSAQTNNSGNYLVIVTNYGGSATSSVATLTVTNIPTVFTLQPISQTVGVGSTVTFSVDGTAQQPFFLQWLKDGTNLTNGTNISGSIISGATNAALSISNAQTNDDGTYWLVVTTGWGVLASSNAALTVVSFPTITVPPTNRMVGLGSTVSFAVTAVGSTPLSYRWQENGTDLVNAGRIGPVTNNVLTITNTQTSDDGGYTVIVTNMVGSVTSSPPAVLTVLTSPLFGSITAAGGTNGGFILSGAGGTNSGTYYVLTTTNLTLPLTNWTSIATNQFDSLGGFIFTNAAQTNAPQLFYLLKLP